MIGRLTGCVVHRSPPQILLDVCGVAYEIDVPMSTYCNLPDLGVEVVLWIHMVVREDGHYLFGFLTEHERHAFRELIRISGVGPKLALAVLSGLSVAELSEAIIRQEAGRLTRIPGVGKKTAERLLLEMKGRLTNTGEGAIVSGGHPPVHAPSDDILAALLALGYSEKEAAPAIKGLSPGISTSEGIRLALRQLSKAP